MTAGTKSDLPFPWLREASARLARNAAGERPPHALLLSGPAGLGKLELARREAAALLCLEGDRPACGQCRSCDLMAGGAHPDFRMVTFETNDRGQLRKEIVIDQVRELIASLQLTHGLSPRKVAVIHPAEAMNRNAANALLKTLEEPAGDAVLILVCNDPARLPATVRSRCQVIDVRQPDRADATRWLVEEQGADPERAALALDAGAGTPLRATALLDSGGLEGYRAVHEALDRLESDSAQLQAAFTALSDLDPAACWFWVSVAAAQRSKAGFAGGAGGGRAVLRRMLDLQAQADRNHRLAATPVRHDLLLRDWLVQWTAFANEANDAGTRP